MLQLVVFSPDFSIHFLLPLLAAFYFTSSDRLLPSEVHIALRLIPRIFSALAVDYKAVRGFACIK
jgi:hypothetical protein